MILIIEDNVPLLRTMRDILTAQFPSLRVEGATTGEKAMERVIADAPEMIFVDINLPGENGLAITRRIKERNPDTFVVMHTSYDTPEYRNAAFDVGANRFLPKGDTSVETILDLVRERFKLDKETSPHNTA